MKTLSTFATFTLIVFGALAAGCATHRHESHYSYEYSDDRAAPPTETQRERVDSEWHMVQPGTMVVDPNRR